MNGLIGSCHRTNWRKMTQSDKPKGCPEEVIFLHVSPLPKQSRVPDTGWAPCELRLLSHSASLLGSFTLPLIPLLPRAIRKQSFCDYFQQSNRATAHFWESRDCASDVMLGSSSEGTRNFFLAACALQGCLPLNLPVHTGCVCEHMLSSHVSWKQHWIILQQRKGFGCFLEVWQRRDLGKPVEWVRQWPTLAGNGYWNQNGLWLQELSHAFLPLILGCRVLRDT